MNKLIHSLLLLCLFTSCITAQIELELEEFASGLSGPLDVQNAGDTRLFAVEQSGVIKIIEEEGNVLPTPFLDISDIVNNNANERGLLGLAFHPDYQENGFFFVNYSGPGGDTRISRFEVTADANVADPNSEVILLEVDQPFSNHNGGGLAFGPDGYLYIGLGDGGSSGDPQNNGQNTNTFLAKMLRIDVNDETSYAIPSDNPFVDNADVLNEIWAIGMRNPWRFSFDRETGDLWIGDVGQNDFEEIDFEPAGSPGGLNYGWRCYEGFSTFNTSGCGSADEYIDPAWDYVNANSVGRSVTGGYVYRGSMYPSLIGQYIYADFVTGRIWSLMPDGSGGWNNEELLNWNNNEIASFGEDINGEMYLVALQQGKIYKVTISCTAFEIDVQATDIICFGDNNGNITVSPPDDNSTIIWDSGETSLELMNLVPGEYTATLTDANGCTAEAISIIVNESEEIGFELEFDANDNIVAPTGFANYEWYNEDGTLIVDQMSSTLMLQGGESGFYVIVTDDNGCMFTSPTYFINSINKIEGLSQFNVSPNPFSNRVILNIHSEQVMDLRLEILNVEGKVLEEEIIQFSGNFSKELNLANLPKGVLFLRLKGNHGMAVQRLVKM